MVAAFDYCLHGRGGAAPSIDTAMHGLVDAAHVDHLHPDSGIALATAVDGEALTKECFGDRVVWVPWRRPGFQLGLDIAAIKRGNPQAIGCILGGHGITAWGDTSDECEAQLAGDHPHAPRRSSPSTAAPSRSAPRADGYEPLPDSRAPRPGRRAGADDPRARVDRPADGRATSPTHPVVLDFLARAEHSRASPALGTSCPDHFLRTKVTPLVLDLPGDAPLDERDRPRCASCTPRTARTTAPTTNATPSPTRPAMRGADPAIVLVPGVGMFSYGEDKQTARVAGEFYVNAINVMRGAEALSTYAPIGEAREVPHRVLGARGGQAAADAEAEAARRPHRARHRRRLRHRQGDRRAAGRRGRVRRRRRPRRRRGRGRRGRDRRRRRRGRRRHGRHRRASRWRPRSTPRCSPSAASTSSSTTPGCRSRSRCSRRPRPTGTCSTT